MSWQQAFEAGNLAFTGGLYEAALPKYQQAVELARSANDLSGIGETSRALTRLYLELNRAEDAETAGNEAFDADQTFWGYDNQQLADDMFWLAEARRRLGKYESAREMMERALAARVGLFGEIHDDSLSSMIGLIWLNLAEEKNYSQVLELMHRATKAFASLHPYGHFAKTLNMQVLLKPYVQRGKDQEAEAISRRVQQALRAVLGDSNQETQQVLKDCSLVMHDANKHMSAWRFKSRAAAMGSQTMPDRLAQHAENTIPSFTKEEAPNHVVPDFEKAPRAASHFAEQPEGTELKPGSRQYEIISSDEPTAEPALIEWPDAGPTSAPMIVDQPSPIESNSFEIPPSDLKYVHDEHRDLLGETLKLAGSDLNSTAAIGWWLAWSIGTAVLSSTIYGVSGFIALTPWSFIFGFVTASIGCLLWLRFIVARHQSLLEKQLPAALDQMAAMLEAGNPVTECFIFLGNNSPPPIRQAFSRCALFLREGRTLQQALTEFGHSFEAHEAKSLTDAINLSRSFGGGLARDVRLIAHDLRERESAAAGASLTSAQVKFWIFLLSIGFAISVAQILLSPTSGAAVLQSAGTQLVLVLSLLILIGCGSVLATPKTSGPAIARLKTKFLRNYSKQQVGNKLRNELPGFLDKIVMLTEIGISLPQAVAQVRNESSASCPTLCHLLDYTLDHLPSFKSAIPNAFRKLGEDYKVQELIDLGSALDAAERTKSSIGYQLKEQSGALRSHLSLSRRARRTRSLYVVFVVALLYGKKKLRKPHS